MKECIMCQSGISQAVIQAATKTIMTINKD
jgi:hypothetical protein